MTQELLKAFVLIFTAEMGDKTQILAMAFATRFSVKKVLLGIFLGSLLNHGLAVVLGSYISSFIPINVIQIVAGFAFIGFSLWTLKSGDDGDENEKQKSKFGPIVTVAIAFFIGELGDKTQLTAITLATDAVYPLVILGGTVLGMIVTGGIGIIIGKKLGDKIPEFTIKVIAASVFMFFGITKLYHTIPSEYLNLRNVSLFIGVIIIAVFMILKPMILRRLQRQDSIFRKTSRYLYNYYHQVSENIDEICLGVDNCGQCQGNSCIIGYTKNLIKNGLDGSELIQRMGFIPKEKALNMHYDKEKVFEGLSMTLALIKKEHCNIENKNIQEIRKNLEMILFGTSIQQMNNWSEYSRCLIGVDEIAAGRVFKSIEN